MHKFELFTLKNELVSEKEFEKCFKDLKKKFNPLLGK